MRGSGSPPDLQSLLGFDRLVLAITPTATRHHPAGELINDHRFAIANDVVHILHEELFGFERIGDEVAQGSLGSKRS